MSTLTAVRGGAPVETPEPSEPTPRRRRWVPYALLLPGLVWLAVFFLAPMATLFSTSLQVGSIDEGYRPAFRIANYTEALSAFSEQFFRSFGYAAMATVLALLVSYPLAYAIAFKAGRWKNVLLVLVIAPFFTSFLVRTLAWTAILGDQGLLLGQLKDIGLVSPDFRLLARPFAVVLGLTYNFLPFMTLPLYASLERIDRRLLEAADDLYSSAFTTFRKVTFPLSLPGVVAGTLLTFIPAAGDYINQRLLGTPRQSMIGTVIDSQFLRVLDYPSAAALSFTLMVSIVVLVWFYVRRAGTEELV